MILTPSFWADLMFAAMLGLIGWHTLRMRREGRLLFLDPLYTFWAGFLICYINQPISHAAVFIEWQGPAVYHWTIFYSLMAAAFVVAGYESRYGPSLVRFVPEFTHRLDQDKLRLAGLTMVGMAFIGYYFMFESAYGVENWLSHGRGGTDYANVSGYVMEMEKFLPLGVFLLLMNVNLHPVSGLERFLCWALTALNGWWFLYLGTRSRLILILVLASAAYYLPRRKNPPLLPALLVIMALFSVTKFQAQYRHLFTNLSFNLDQIDMDQAKAICLPGFLGGEKDVQQAHLTPGIDFNVAMCVVDLVPEKVSYNYGLGFLEFFTRPIPRSLWPEKIYPSLQSWQGVLRQARLSTASVRGTDLIMGPAFTFVAFWYYILGPLSLAIGGFYTGVLLRLIRSIFDRKAGSSEGNLILYACLLPVGFGEAASTPFNWIYEVPLAVLIPLALLLRLCARREAGRPAGTTLTAEAA